MSTINRSTKNTKSTLNLPFMPISEEIEQDSCIFGDEILLSKNKSSSNYSEEFKLTTKNRSNGTFLILQTEPKANLGGAKDDNFTPKTDATLDPDSCKRLNKMARKMKKKVNLASGFKFKKKNSRRRKGKKVKILEPEDLGEEHILNNNLKNAKVKPVTKKKLQLPKAAKKQPIKEEKEQKSQADLELKKFYSLKFEQKMELIRNLDKHIVRHFFEKDYEGKIFASFERKLKEDPYFLRKFKLPLIVNLKGKVEYMDGYSYHDLLSLKEFGNACRDCQVNALDATKDKRRKITKKIWSRLRHIYFLNRPESDPNLRFNRRETNTQFQGEQGYQFNGRAYGYF